MRHTKLAIVPIIANLALVLSLGCHRAEQPLIFGDDWQSFTRLQKESFVSGFIDGATNSAVALCNKMKSHILVLKFDNETKAPSDPADSPCLQFRPRYSHVIPGDAWKLSYVDPYVQVMDDFYRHPECRIIPYTVIMDHLNDEEYKSGEDLYRFVRSGNAPWGSFTGFDGMEKCYGVDAKH
jgi:hypothetical protein